jgi:hypothetical protein
MYMLLIVLALYVVFVLASHHAKYDKVLDRWEQSTFEIKSSTYAGTGAKFSVPTRGPIEKRPTLLEFGDSKVTLPWISIPISLDWFVRYIPIIYFFLTVVYWFWAGSYDRSVWQLRSCSPAGSSVCAHTVPWLRTMYFPSSLFRALWAMIVDLLPVLFVVGLGCLLLIWQGNLWLTIGLYSSATFVGGFIGHQMALGVQRLPKSESQVAFGTPMRWIFLVGASMSIAFQPRVAIDVGDIFHYWFLVIGSYIGIVVASDVLLFGFGAHVSFRLLIDSFALAIVAIVLSPLLIKSSWREKYFERLRKRRAKLRGVKLGGTLGYYIHSDIFRSPESKKS